MLKLPSINNVKCSKSYFHFSSEFDIMYRVMPIEHLIRLIKDEINILVNPSKWDDPFENYVATSKFMCDNRPTKLNLQKEKYFCQCWTLNQIESDALWRIYSPGKNGVRIRSSAQRLFNPLLKRLGRTKRLNAYLGSVSYFTEKDILHPLQHNIFNSASLIDSAQWLIFQSLLIKRKSFEHEKEARLILYGKSNLAGGMYGYQIIPREFIEEVLFDPRMDKNIYEIFRKYLEELLPGCPISQSKLYDRLDLTINLTD